MGAEGTKESNKRQSNNDYVEMPLNPLTSPRGGLLTLQCILFSFETPRYHSRKEHFCGNVDKTRYTPPQNYLFIVVAINYPHPRSLLFTP